MKIITPYYKFDKSKFEAIVRAYQAIGEVYYPIKANDNELVVNVAMESSCSFEVDSIEHLKMLICKKGLNPDRLLYSYPIREVRDIKDAFKLNVRKYVVDSVEEYNKVVSIVKNALFFVRLNIADLLKFNLRSTQNKWGLSIDHAKDLIHKIRENGNDVIGISFYLFKEVVDSSTPKDRLEKLEKTLRSLIDNFSGLDIQYLNIGGGISPDNVKNIENTLNRAKAAIGAKYAIIEPGSPLLDPCIDMVVSVIAIKRINGSNVVFINSGIYRGLIDVIIKGKRFDIFDFKNCDGKDQENTLVCGSSSDVIDFLGEYELRTDLKVGDRLIVKGCGAYSSVMQTGFYKKNSIKMIISEDSE
jgi:ornithine decarboxylase